MNILKISIFSACIIGIISSIAEIAMPNGTLRNQMKLITALILILAVFTPFMGKGFDIDFESLEKFSDADEYTEMTEEFKSMYLNMSNEKIEETLLNLLRKENIMAKKVVIDSDYGEYNSLEVKKATVTGEYFTDSEKKAIREILKECLPNSDVEISEVTPSENSSDSEWDKKTSVSTKQN